MKKYIVIKHTSPKCWQVYIGNEIGEKFSTSLTDYFFNEKAAMIRATYMTTFTDIVGILLVEEAD